MKKLLLSVVVFIITLLLAAVLMDVFKTEEQASAQYFRTRNIFQYNTDNVVYDAGRGYTLKPDLQTTFTNNEFSTGIRTNIFGFRDDNVSLNNPDVLIVGDSYAWGWGVEENEGVEKQLEQLTGTRILNMSVPGYGNIQELLTLFAWERRGTLQGKDILLFFCANDLQDNQNTSFGAFPYFVQEGNGIRLHNPTKEAFDTWLQTANGWMIHNTIAQKNILAYYTLAAIKNAGNKDLYKDYHTGDNKLNGANALLQVAVNLQAIQTQQQARITIVYVPPYSYYITGKADASLALMQDICKKTGLRFADLSAILSKTDYYPLDKHWRATGHQKAAQYLQPFINQ
jgi:hypothetical protein